MQHSFIQNAVSVLITVAVAFTVISIIILVNKMGEDDKLKAN